MKTVIAKIVFHLIIFFLPVIIIAQGSVNWAPDGNSYFRNEGGEIVKYTLPQNTKTVIVKKENLKPACDKGKVKYNDAQAKASKQVNVGEEYEVKTEAKRWRIKVTGLLHKRVAYSEAVKYYIDITPDEEVERLKFQAASFHTGKRRSKIGRPTKKERRDMDDFMET